MGFNENLRGQTNSIILFILLNGDRHTDELKEIIDENFSTVKIGTLYSIISRMKTQGQISEYRASSSDGSRRKYYKITEAGKKVFFDEYYEMFEGVNLPENIKTEEEKQPEITKNVEEVDENEDLYLKYIKKAEESESYNDIDFSSVITEEEPKKESKKEESEVSKKDTKEEIKEMIKEVLIELLVK